MSSSHLRRSDDGSELFRYLLDFLTLVSLLILTTLRPLDLYYYSKVVIPVTHIPHQLSLGILCFETAPDNKVDQ